MKPQFALSLSFQGIGLLHRRSDGWTDVGSVSLDDPSFEAGLAQLRQSAIERAGDGFTTKLIIPDEQIKFMALEGCPDDVSEAYVEEVLTGATPYDLIDLIYDWQQVGDEVRIAAVAIETLGEAEAFAKGYGFNPISFVAVPPDGSLDREIFFGPTSCHTEFLPSGAQVSPDVKLTVATPEPLADTPEIITAVEPPAPSFVSRRSATAVTSAAAKAPETTLIAPPPPEISRTARALIEGAKAATVETKPKKAKMPLGLVMTFALLVLMAVASLWASFSPTSEPDVTIAETAPESLPEPQPETPSETAPDTPDAPISSDEETASVETAQDTPEDVAEDDIPLHAPEISAEDASRIFADSGAWVIAPPTLPTTADREPTEAYFASADPIAESRDAVAIPARRAFLTDTAFVRRTSAPLQNLIVELNELGLVVATPQGAVSPDGYTVFAGRPAKVPPTDLKRLDPEELAALEEQARLAKIRPKLRPESLSETYEKLVLGGRTRDQMALLRPAARPKDLANAAPPAKEEQAKPAAKETSNAEADEDNADQGITSSPTPKVRAPEKEEKVATAVAPKIPTKASVAKNATVKDAINLRKVNLLGVFLKPSGNTALVRMPNGKTQRVKIGDKIDGGKVAAISQGKLVYVKSGRSITLQMPKG